MTTSSLPFVHDQLPLSISIFSRNTKVFSKILMKYFHDAFSTTMMKFTAGKFGVKSFSVLLVLDLTQEDAVALLQKCLDEVSIYYSHVKNCHSETWFTMVKSQEMNFYDNCFCYEIFFGMLCFNCLDTAVSILMFVHDLLSTTSNKEMFL